MVINSSSDFFGCCCFYLLSFFALWISVELFGLTFCLSLVIFNTFLTHFFFRLLNVNHNLLFMSVFNLSAMFFLTCVACISALFKCVLCNFVPSKLSNQEMTPVSHFIHPLVIEFIIKHAQQRNNKVNGLTSILQTIPFSSIYFNPW